MIELFFPHIHFSNIPSYNLTHVRNASRDSKQDCFLEADWQRLIHSVQDNLLSYKVVTGGAVIFSNAKNMTSETGIDSSIQDFGYPRPLTQYVIKIENPPDLVQLSSIPDQRILVELVKLLDVPNRGWAAHILIAKMLGHDSVSSDSRERWWIEKGKTGKAKKFWESYIQRVKPTLQWKSDWGYYRHISPNGRLIEYCPQSEVCVLPNPKK
jgi:hypothetical protein